MLAEQMQLYSFLCGLRTKPRNMKNTFYCSLQLNQSIYRLSQSLKIN